MNIIFSQGSGSAFYTSGKFTEQSGILQTRPTNCTVEKQDVKLSRHFPILAVWSGVAHQFTKIYVSILAVSIIAAMAD